ncbi:MAG: dTMP kinase [Oscillospiraceae bacterium]|nr:dTMP kinase [Oscillospiraceae bacterium]
MFITIDGPDGTGKTTVAKALYDFFKEKGQDCIYTAEPTDTPLGRRIRELLRTGDATPSEMTKLFIEDRIFHVYDLIIPERFVGKTIICDRYKYSTVCYQHLQGEPLEMLIEYNAPFPVPDLSVILLTENAEILMDRIGGRGGSRDIFETKTALEKTISLYQDMKDLYPQEHFLYLDACQPIEKTVQAIYDIIKNNN